MRNWEYILLVLAIAAIVLIGVRIGNEANAEPVKSETVVLLQDIEETTSGSTVLLKQILHKTDEMVTVQYLDSVLQAKERAYNHNVLVEHMETCEHKAKSSTAGVTTKTE